MGDLLNIRCPQSHPPLPFHQDSDQRASTSGQLPVPCSRRQLHPPPPARPQALTSPARATATAPRARGPHQLSPRRPQLSPPPPAGSRARILDPPAPAGGACGHAGRSVRQYRGACAEPRGGGGGSVRSGGSPAAAAGARRRRTRQEAAGRLRGRIRSIEQSIRYRCHLLPADGGHTGSGMHP